ncbi:alpha/beta hydrolase [bacterium SCSIO 12741]|nr:alpha/beta hydrolase [bacterium SCSIO 12741]
MFQEKHFFITNRLTTNNGVNKIVDKNDRWDQSGELHYAPMRTSGAMPVVEEWNDQAQFELQVLEKVKNMPPGKRNVVIYFHGFYGDPRKNVGSYMYKVFNGMKHAYTKDAALGIGCILHFSWPSGGVRELVDDKAHAQGVSLYKHNLDKIKKLYDTLKANNIRLHLMGHSFAMQLFNGFASQIKPADRQMFDKIFLFAPDLPYKSIQPGGVVVTDPIHKKEDPNADDERKYDFTRLNQIGGEVHVFWNEFDYLLYGSTQLKLKAIKKWKKDEYKDPEKRKEHADGHTVLGIMGGTNGQPANFYFHDIHNKLKPTEKAFQYRNPNDLGLGLRKEYRAMIAAKKPGVHDFSDIHAKWNAITSAITGGHKINAHRCMFSTQKVVSTVKSLL